MNPLYQTMATSVFERMSGLAARHGALNLGQGVAWDNYIGRGVRRNYAEALGWLIVGRQRGAQSNADEALRNCDLTPLFDLLARQPTWSDLPMVLLTHHGGQDQRGQRVMQFAFEGFWISDLYSFFTREESKLNIEALEDCELLLLDHEQHEHTADDRERRTPACTCEREAGEQRRRDEIARE